MNSLAGRIGVLGLVLLVSAAVSLGAEPRNLVDNPSLEDIPAADGLPRGWNGFHSEPAGGYSVAIVEPGHTGQRSLKVTGDGKFVVVRANRLDIDRTKRYRAEGWAKIEGHDTAAADVKFHYYAADGTYLGQSRIGFVAPRTPGWQRITVTDQIELFPKATAIELAVALAGQGTAWFDDLRFTAREEARPAAVNWIANGDMEDIGADRPGGWHVATSEGGHVTCRSDDKIRHAGERSLYLKGNAEWSAAGSVKVPIDRTQAYLLTGFVRAKAGRAHLSIVYFEGDNFLGHTAAEPVAADETWQKQSLAIDAADYPAATHVAAVASGAGDVEAWFDDLILTAKPK